MCLKGRNRLDSVLGNFYRAGIKRKLIKILDGVLIMQLLSVCLLLYLGNQFQKMDFYLFGKDSRMILCPWGKQERKRTKLEKENKKKKERERGEANTWFIWQIVRLGEWMRVRQAWTRICILLCIRTPTKAWSKIRWNSAWWPSDAFAGRALLAWRPTLWI